MSKGRYFYLGIPADDVVELQAHRDYEVMYGRFCGRKAGFSPAWIEKKLMDSRGAS